MRHGDVAGFEIPSRYFHFIRTGDVRPLVAIVEHNRLDLLSLAALTGRLLYLTRVGPDAVRTASEALALGRTYTCAGDEERARAAFAKSIAMSRAPAGAFDPVRADALRALALLWRRARHYEEAARCWQQLVEMRGCPSSLAREAAEALAIHNEHRVRNLSAAKAFALLGLRMDAQPAWTRSIHHRLARLDRKLEARTLDYDG
jgi:tetratricopeptide (TPR) repeat protein